MNHLRRPRAAALGASVVAATLYGLLWGPGAPPPAVGDAPECHYPWDLAAAREDRALDEGLAAIRLRIRAKEDAALALLRGDLTLDEAAGRFRALNAVGPPTLGAMRLHFPGASDEELNYRQVLTHAREFARRDPSLAARLARLEGELRGRFPARAADPNHNPIPDATAGRPAPSPSTAGPTQVRAAGHVGGRPRPAGGT